MVTRPTLQVLQFPSSFSIKSSVIPVQKFQKHVSALPYISSSYHSDDTWVLATSTESAINPSQLSSAALSPALAVAGQVIASWLQSEYSISISTELLGNLIKCQCFNVPAGLGEPCFDKFQAVLCKELLRLNSARSFEVGTGFDGTLMRGSEHNDVFEKCEAGIRPVSNHAGGVLGGITNGNTVEFRVGFGNVPEAAELLVQAVSAVVILDFINIQKVRKFKE